VCGAHLEWGERFSRLFPPLPDLPPADMDLRPDRWVGRGMAGVRGGQAGGTWSGQCQQGTD
jgi:hypothetical protein